MVKFEVKDITVVRNDIPVLDNVSAGFLPKQIHAVIGPNGAGKSTFLSTLCGILRPQRGCLLWKNQDLLDKSRKEWSRVTSFVPQNPHPAFSYSVSEMVAMGLFSRTSVEKQDEEVEEVLSAVDILPMKERSILSLSGGERQRVYIARALITRAPILVMDEPFSSLDFGQQERLWDLLVRLAAEGKSVILSTHDLQKAEMFADRTLLLHQGKRIGEGEFAQLKEAIDQIFHRRAYNFTRNLSLFRFSS